MARRQRGRVFQAGARAAPTALRNRRLCKARRCQLAAARTPPEGKVERGAVVRPRAPPLHARGPSVVPLSVVSVSLLERQFCVAQVPRLQRDYFKLDNYERHDLGRASHSTPNSLCTYARRTLAARATSRCWSNVYHANLTHNAMQPASIISTD